MLESVRFRLASIAVAICLLGLLESGTSAQDVSALVRDMGVIEGDAQGLVRQRLERSAQRRSPTHVEERLTDGELFYRLQDYVRASIIFTDIVDHYPQHRAFPDALFLLGDSLFRAGDYLGSRTRFRQLLDRSEESMFRPYLSRAVGRLIEVAIHTRDFEGVEDYFARLSRLPPSEIEAATTYYRAKYLYNRAVPTEDVLVESAGTNTGAGEQPDAPAPSAEPAAPTGPQIDQAMLDQARLSFEAVAEGSPYYPQARYFVGVIYTLRAQYPQGIEAFRRVLRSEVSTAEHQTVVHLTQLALGRLYYETDQLDQAVEAYQAVPRTSPNFDIALYEIAWVYIRQGDATRAERALEVLAIAAPGSRFIPDGKLLRGNLLLRNGRFDDANEVFRDVRRQFGPVRRELDDVLESHEDAPLYFRELVRNNLEAFDANAFLPPLARQWASQEGDIDRALSVLGDLSQARQLVRETSDLIERLNAALGAANRVNVFADLRRHREGTVGLRNRLATMRQRLIDAEGGSVASEGGGELGTVREQRRRIERLIGRMPTEPDDFSVRNDQVLGRYVALQRELSALEVETMGLDARIVAVDRFMEATADQQRDPDAQAAVRTEAAQHRQAVLAYHAQLEDLRRRIEVGRLQVGVGDQRYQRDGRLRDEYNRLVARERELLAGMGRGRSETDRLFDRAVSVESVLDRHDALIDDIVNERTADMLAVIAEETTNVEGYRVALSNLEGEAEEVVGAVTYANFRRVRQRFYDLVLRADVGRIDVSWAEREEHRMRVDMLTRERSQGIQSLDDEFREIMDEQPDTGTEEPQP